MLAKDGMINNIKLINFNMEEIIIQKDKMKEGILLCNQEIIIIKNLIIIKLKVDGLTNKEVENILDNKIKK
jgi:hypothetical protein